MDDMVATMREYEGVGLAAPQVHESKQIIVIESAGSIRYSEAPNIPLTILINPFISYYSKEKERKKKENLNFLPLCLLSSFFCILPIRLCRGCPSARKKTNTHSKSRREKT